MGKDIEERRESVRSLKRISKKHLVLSGLWGAGLLACIAGIIATIADNASLPEKIMCSCFMGCGGIICFDNFDHEFTEYRMYKN